MKQVWWPIRARTPSLVAIVVLAHDFLLPGVHRDHRLTHPLELPHTAVDAPELSVPTRMLAAFQRLEVGLKAVAQGVQQAIHRVFADRVPSPV